MRLPDFSFVVLDTETTGFTPGTNRVIEFAMMRGEKGEIVDELEQLISIPDSIPPHVQTLTRIYPDDLTGKPDFDEVRELFKEHIGKGTVIIGQNIQFDIRFLKAEGIDLTDHPWIDTSMLASVVFPEFASYSLGYMSTVLDLPHAPVHRALGDVRATLHLLEHIWARFLELPSAHRQDAIDTLSKGGEGYKRFVMSLPTTTTDSAPEWLNNPNVFSIDDKENANDIDFPLPNEGTVDLIDDTLNPQAMQSVVQACLNDTSKRHWIAVKNLDALLRRIPLPDGVQVVRHPLDILDSEQVDRLYEKPVFTPDESTLALKLRWYAPTNRQELPLHGGEKDVWTGKMACTRLSNGYTDQFMSDAGVFLINHHHLLHVLSDENHSGKQAFSDNDHLIVEDASMLEDTASKAFGAYVSLDDLRAAAEGDNQLTKIVDLAELWTAKARNNEDLHFITPSDTSTPETKGLRTQVDTALERDNLPERTREQLLDLQKMIATPDKGTVAWIELKPNGSHKLLSAPERVSFHLAEHLYGHFAVSLLVPPVWNITEVLPESIGSEEKADVLLSATPVSLMFDLDTSLMDFLKDPPKGKTVILAGSKRLVEQVYVEYAVELEKKGYDLFCQGLSGGQGRMQAEFSAAEGNSILVLTPWMYEGFELPSGTVDHFIIDALPFDHPSHPIFSRRANHYKNAFMDYSLPRLMHRLFRLLRTFYRHKTDKADVLVLDNRIKTKKYGKAVQEYLEVLCQKEVADEEDGGQMQLL